MKIQLSDHFSFGRILRFTFPSIAMMVFTSIYGVVDGLFVSNFVGETAFAAVNFIMPVLMVLGSLGFLFGTGGNALIAKALGERRPQRARQLLSLLVYVSSALGVVIALAGIFLLRPVAQAMGAQGKMLDDCVLYGSIILLATPFYMLQMEFQSYFVTAEKPQLGLWVTVAAGVTNMVLDALFIAVFQWGLAGAALATATSQLVGGLSGVVYFAWNRRGSLYLTRTGFDGKALLDTCINGSSELMSNVSMSLVSILYNIQLMDLAGEAGVSAYGVLMYVNMIFLAIFIGFSVGSAPIISFHFGAQNKQELHSLLKKGLIIILVTSASMLGLAWLMGKPLAQIFVGANPELCSMTTRAFYIFAFSFLFAGVAIFGSSFFTALSDGLTSALISFLRTLVFQVAAVLILPVLWGLDGIWWSIVVAEGMAFLLTALFLLWKRKKYGY